jgi:uncharacterized repeat protein (TIGR01451 family)
MAATVGLLAALAMSLGVAAVPASALGGPVWEASSEAIPTNLPPGGTGEYVVHVRNVGTAPTDSSPVTVVDRLPAGVTATAAGGEIAESLGLSGEYWTCAITTAVTCTSSRVIAPGSELTAGRSTATAPLIVIDVAVSPDAGAECASLGECVNAVSVSGGGAGEAASSLRTTIASAPAGFGLASFEQLSLNRNGAPAVQAGAHPYELITNLALNNPGRAHLEEVPESGEVKDLEVGLPPGFVGNPNATPKCPRVDFDRGRAEPQGFPLCSTNTQVGTVTVTLVNPFFTLVLPVYNLEPPPGEAAQFGFAYQFRVGFIDFGVRGGEGYAVKAVLQDIDQLSLLRTELTVWGVPADPGHDAERGAEALDGGRPVADSAPPIPLLTNPTSCYEPLTGLVSADSWAQPTESSNPFSYPATEPYFVTDNRASRLQMTQCEGLAFEPEVKLAPGPEAAASSTPTGLTTEVHFPPLNVHPDERVEANLKNVALTFPLGMTVSPSAANGLQVCTAAQIGLDNGDEPTCPDASKIGVVEIVTPVLEQPLRGFAYVAKQEENPFGSLLAVYLTAEGDGVSIKLAGHVRTDPTTGQVTVTFDEAPEQPFTDLKVSLFEGPRAALVSPSACGTYTPSAQLTGYNGAVVVPALQSFSVTSGCSHGFSPAFAAGVDNYAAGRPAPFSVSIQRPDGDQMLGAVSVTTPPGLLGMLSQVPRCGEPQAAQGTCPEASKIGDTTAAAGPGPDPVTVSGGRVYLTGPYRGAPFGLSIVVPAVAGPFNLGNVVVRAAIHVDPHTAQITVLSDPLPTIVQGIPLQIRQIEVDVDRSGFMFNPTSCAPLAVTGTLASAEGAAAAVSSRFQAADCASLPFKPGFAVSTQGATSKAHGASLDVKVTSGAGQANIGRVFVTLPKQLPSRLTTLQQACPEATFAANPAACPAASVVGSAKAVTPVLDEPATGPAYLVSHGGAAFPDLVVILQAQGVRLDLVGNTNVAKGITTSNFASVPDAPVSSFELNLPEGPHSALSANLPAKAHRNLCGTKLVMPTTITGQNGAQVTQNTRIAVSGCPRTKPKPKVKKSRAKSRRAHAAAR